MAFAEHYHAKSYPGLNEHCVGICINECGYDSMRDPYNTYKSNTKSYTNNRHSTQTRRRLAYDLVAVVVVVEILIRSLIETEITRTHWTANAQLLQARKDVLYHTRSERAEIFVRWPVST